VSKCIPKQMRLELLMEIVGTERRVSEVAFQAIGPATENARRLSVLRRCANEESPVSLNPTREEYNSRPAGAANSLGSSTRLVRIVPIKVAFFAFRRSLARTNEVK